MGRAADTVALSFCLFENGNPYYVVCPPITGDTAHIHIYIKSEGKIFAYTSISFNSKLLGDFIFSKIIIFHQPLQSAIITI